MASPWVLIVLPIMLTRCKSSGQGTMYREDQVFIVPLQPELNPKVIIEQQADLMIFSLYT
jgi:lipoprotein NlpI